MFIPPRESADAAPLGAHGGGRIEGDLAPFGGAVDDENDVANFGGFEDDSGDAGFSDWGGDVEESGEVEASTGAAEFADFGGELLLGFDPGAVGGGG